MAISRGLCSFLLLFVLVAVAVIIPLVLLLGRKNPSCGQGFTHGAVAADSGVCSDIGRDILKQGGSPVDGAIAALICTSVIHPQSMGLGGGVIFTIYNALTGDVEVINARETVPARSPPNLMEQCSTPGFLKPGVQWIGVPGELRGYEAAHQRHGRLPWKMLFEPTIKLVSNGIQVSSLLNSYVLILSNQIKKYSLCELLCKDKEVLKKGQVLNFTQLGHTLQMVADNGVDSFYEGPLAKKMIEDLQSQGSILTLDDFKNYKVQIMKPLKMSLETYTLYTPPPPAAGALLSFILNVLQGYHFSKNTALTETEQIQNYHYIAETLKFATGQQARLAEAIGAENMAQITSSLLSESFAQKIRERIDDSGNHTLSFYNVSATHPDTYGTSHVSVISQDGSSVSVTSSINHIFGSMIYSPSTGIIFNNQLADFCTGSSIRPIKEGEQPPSSMTPSIILSHDKKTQLAIGGSGGKRIISATVQAIVNKLWLGYNITEAIAAPVLHVTSDNKLNFEPSFGTAIREGLLGRGQKLDNSTFRLNVVQGVSQENGCLFPCSDERKFGRASGY